MSAVLGKFLWLFSKLPAILPRRPNVSKRSLLLVASVGGLFTFLITAIYMRRRRKAFSSINLRDVEEANRIAVAEVQSERRRKKPKSKRLDYLPSSHASSSVRSAHTRENSMMSESSAVSSVRSSTSRHYKIPHLPAPGTKAYYDAEHFYRIGMDAFETAIAQWEKAGEVLGSEHSDVSSGRSGHLSHNSRRTIHTSESNTSRRRTPKSRSRRSSVIRQRVTSDGPHRSCQSDIPDSGAGDNILVGSDECDSSPASEMEQTLLLFMERAEKLQKTFEGVLYSSGSETDSDTNRTLTGCDHDVDSDTASFASAQEVWDQRFVDDFPDQKQFGLYRAALDAVDAGTVLCRTMRTEMLECFSDDEFLAKLHCVRQALNLMLEDATVRDWLIKSGQDMIKSLLKVANRDTSPFINSFQELIEYVGNSKNWTQIEEELKGRKVVSMTFYDIVLDFIIMDSFDDLERPPSQLVTVLGNRWLTNSIKETALSTAVWSVLKAKSRLLKHRDGFIAKFYALSETVSPVLAWGFLGTDEGLKSNCEKFKSEVLDFLRDMFSFEHVRYTTRQQMADDILLLTRQRAQIVLAHFQGKR